MKLYIMKNLVTLIIGFHIIVFNTLTSHAQVGIGTTTPNANALLDIDATNNKGGLLLPRVALINTMNPEPLTQNVAGMTVYNTATNGDVTPGFYCNDGTSWIRLGAKFNENWQTIGNTGTDPSTNFIGTTDAQDFVIKTNNNENIRLSASGNLGIGTNTPIAKTHISQSAASDVILIDHSGTAGNAIEINHTDINNGNSAIFVKNSGLQQSVLVQNFNTGSTSSAVMVQSIGLGNAFFAQNLNTGASGAGLFVDQYGTGAFSRGIDINMDANNSATGTTIFHSGTGAGLYLGLTRSTNLSTGSSIYHDGLGSGTYMNLTNSANTSVASTILHEGIGRGQNVILSKTTNASLGYGLFHSGTGRGGNISLSNTANTEIGWGVFHSGTGTGIYSQAVDDAIFGLVTGNKGGAGTFVVNSTSADRDAIGALIVYNGSGTSGVGGGNALEVQHNGNNGNGIEVFLGNPALAAGPANTTSEYNALTVSQFATGTSPTAGLSKSAINASNNSADPAILVFNNGNEQGSGIESFVAPNGLNDPISIFGQAADNTNEDYGVGIQGVGGWYGVRATKVGANFAWTYGLFCEGDMTSTGAKAFTIDHPLDPENKALRHYSIESNEILNMYRGIIELDTNGEAIVKLPEYFEAININPTYQLTGIGSPIQPYINKEIKNNQFSIKGAANTKVSWTIHAKRNDPTIRYFNSNGKKYNSDVFDKPLRMKGKYYTPEAYGKKKNQGIHYMPTQENTASEQESFTKQLKAKSNKIKLKKASENSTKKQKIEMPVKVTPEQTSIN
jgi:hypothetical protein